MHEGQYVLVHMESGWHSKLHSKSYQSQWGRICIWISRGIRRQQPEPQFEVPFSNRHTKTLPAKVLGLPLDVVHIGVVELSFRMEFKNWDHIHV